MRKKEYACICALHKWKIHVHAHYTQGKYARIFALKKENTCMCALYKRKIRVYARIIENKNVFAHYRKGKYMYGRTVDKDKYVYNSNFVRYTHNIGAF